MKYHSWSQKARVVADHFLEWEDLDLASRTLHNSYRHQLIKRRALKRFGRKRKKLEKTIDK